MKRNGLLITTVASALCSVAMAETSPNAQNNVLFIIVDDLRPELNCYGVEGVVSENIDRLAGQSAQFMNAYSNIPVSGASRASLMTGMRPTRDRFLNVEALIEVDAPNIPTLPRYFKEHGYTTISNSKIIHGESDALDSWDEVWMPSEVAKSGRTWRNYIAPHNLDKETFRHGPEAFEAIDVEDDAYYDGVTANKTIEDLRRLKSSGEPFFLAVGILKPHLPFNAPKRYWDLYPEDSIDLADSFYFDRDGFPIQAFHSWGELRYYKDIDDKADVNEDMAKRLIRGYKACVSYADAQIGKILDELERLGLDETTTVVLIGDHGWSLGEHNQWCKHSNFSIANHTVMMIRPAGMREGRKINTVTEFVDLYPTICAASALSTPDHVEGENLMPSIINPKIKSKDYAVIKWHSGVTHIDSKYAYTEWYNKNDEAVANMLFDIEADPLEINNLSESRKYRRVVERQRRLLRSRRGLEY